MRYLICLVCLSGCCTDQVLVKPQLDKIAVDSKLIQPCVKPQTIKASQVAPSDLLSVRQTDVANYSDCASRFEKYVNDTSNLVEVK